MLHRMACVLTTLFVLFALTNALSEGETTGTAALSGELLVSSAEAAIQAGAIGPVSLFEDALPVDREAGVPVIKRDELVNWWRDVECQVSSSLLEEPEYVGRLSPGCYPPEGKRKCGRKVIDGLFSEEEVEGLKAIADKGLAGRPAVGGPAIVDVNTGFVRDGNGLSNLFAEAKATEDGEEGQAFTPEEFALYARVIRRLRSAVLETFDLDELFFTAPTFIARLDGDPEWKPSEVHDEYWHPHVDGNNTPHYQYSGLLYLSDYETDFEGGRFKFLPSNHYDRYEDGLWEESYREVAEEERPEEIIEPSAGRVVIFSAGPENTHHVERLTKGRRHTLSFWFTCDPERQFQIFLDGPQHLAFSHRMRERFTRGQ